MELPRVTDVLKSAGLIETSFFTEEARDRGKYVHAATVIDEQGDLDESFGPTIQYMPYIQAWRKFLAEHVCKWTHIEQRLKHPQFRYCGTPDRVGTVDSISTIVDLKSGAAARWHRLQLAAYQAMVLNGQKYRRMVVRLQDDGNYKVDPWFDYSQYAADLSVFLACLTIHNFKIMEGI